MHRLRLAAYQLQQDFALDVVDPTVRRGLRGLSLLLLGLFWTLWQRPADAPSLLVAVLLLGSILHVSWHLLRPHVLFHPALRAWCERDPRAYRHINRLATILVVTGLLPLALLFGLLLLLLHGALTLGVAPPPVPIIDSRPAVAEIQPASAEQLAYHLDPLGLSSLVRAPPTLTDDAVDAITAVVAVATAAIALFPSLADLLAIALVAVRRVPPLDLAPRARGSLPHVAAPRAPPLAA